MLTKQPVVPSFRVDPEITKLTHAFLESGVSCMNHSARATTVDVDRRDIPKKIRGSAMGGSLLHKSSRKTAEQAAVEKFDKQILYIDGSRYDETSLPLNVREDMTVASTHDMSEALQALNHTAALHKQGVVIPVHLHGQAVILKVFQSEPSYTMLVAKRRDDGEDEYIVFQGGGV